MSDIPINKLSDYKWEIPKGAVAGMRVPRIIYADERLLKDILKDKSTRQVANGATLPGIVGASMAMPDMPPPGTGSLTLVDLCRRYGLDQACYLGVSQLPFH